MSSTIFLPQVPHVAGESEAFPDSVLIDDLSSSVQASRDQFRSTIPMDLVVYAAISALFFLAWKFSQMGLFESGDDIGYWIGVAGGVMMMLLFSYPLRKHFRFARNWGRVKWWFLVHMFLGVAGPILILVHSTFRVGSLNAAVAMYSMLAVAASGIAGRFIYARVNRGLRGEKEGLDELQFKARLQQEDARSKLAFAPEVEARLLDFQHVELNARPGWMTYLRQVLWLPVHQWLLYRKSAANIRSVLRDLAKRDSWSGQDLVRREKNATRLVSQYLNAVTRVAQFTAYARLFSLWHVVHIPFVYLMVISAVVHVLAVHIY